MEHVIVSHPQERTVYVDGEPGGQTNVSLRLASGTHIFEVEGVVGSQSVNVSGTTVLDPLRIEFDNVIITGEDAEQVTEAAVRLSDSRDKSTLASEHLRLVQIMLFGVFAVSVFFAVLGVVLVYLGATEEMEISLLGQKMSSTGPGIAAMFLGAVLIGSTGRQLFNYLRNR